MGKVETTVFLSLVLDLFGMSVNVSGFAVTPDVTNIPSFHNPFATLSSLYRMVHGGTRSRPLSSEISNQWTE
jgi:hypothetical protein